MRCGNIGEIRSITGRRDMVKNIIRWFVLLLRKDMQSFEMDEATNKTIHRQIMRRTGKDGGKE
jgi:hypothetical protein